MTATLEPITDVRPTDSIASPPPLLPSHDPSRLDSVDALRGVVMFTMLFVNDVAGVRGIPAWMKHYPEHGNGMTFVDWVFGGFLFIVGVSIPIAFHNRLARGEPLWRLVLHVLTRTAGLLLLGVFMVNCERRPTPIGWPAHLWEFLVYAFGILAFLSVGGSAQGGRHSRRADLHDGMDANRLGRSLALPGDGITRARKVNILLRLLGFAGFAMLAFVFRDAKGEWMRPSWWGILGLIGWAYLVASVAYLLLRNHRDLLAGMVAILIAVFFAAEKGFFDDHLAWLNRYVDVGSMLGAHAAIAMAGALLGSRLLTSSPQNPLAATPRVARLPMTEATRPIVYAIVLGIFLALGALLCYRHFHINKNNATPSWCLICAAYTCWLWAALSLFIDRFHIVRPLNFFIRGGQNVLLAYLLAPLILHFIWMMHLDFYGKLGAISPAAGITRSLVMAAVILWLSSFLKDRGVRLRL